MKNKLTGLMGILFSFALLFGLAAGMGLTAYAATDTYSGFLPKGSADGDISLYRGPDFTGNSLHSHTADGQTIIFESWDRTDSLPTEAGSYYLKNNVTLTDTWNVPEGSTNLCLNGKSITLDGNSRGGVIDIQKKDASLHLFDELENEGTITGGKDGGVNVYRGEFTMNGGTITGNTAIFGGGVYVAASCTFTMNGGAITDNQTVYSKGGSIGGGVYVDAHGKFIMNGGSITKNVAHTKDDFWKSGGIGGGIYISFSGSFTMTGGSITENIAEGIGGGVYNKGSFELSGNPLISGNIRGGYNTSNNIYLADGTFIYLNGALTNTRPIGISMQGAGVFTSITDPIQPDEFIDKFTSDDDSDEGFIITATDENTLMLQHKNHSMSFYPSGNTVTAECAFPESCNLPDHKVTLTIEKPTLTVCGQTGTGISEKATLSGLTDFNAATEMTHSADTIKYYKATVEKGVYTKGDLLSAAPADAGDYIAELEIRSNIGSSRADIFVGYTISPAENPDQKAADAVIGQLKKITSSSSQADAQAAVKAYEALTARQKQLVDDDKNAAAALVTAKSLAAKADTAKETTTLKTASVKLTRKQYTIRKGKSAKIKYTAKSGKLTFRKTKGNSRITVTKAGKIKVAKSAKNKTYTIKVKITAPKTETYKAFNKTYSIKVKVKK